jgi:hypothetical protein
MRLWDWYTARRRRKADEWRLEERRRDEAMGDNPGKAMNEAAEAIAFKQQLGKRQDGPFGG